VKYRFVQSIAIVATLTALSGCSMLSSLGKSRENPLLELSCPMLTGLTDDSFEETTRKLAEVTDQYYQCRRAALGVD